MKLNEAEVNNHLQSLLGRDGDSFQQAWVEILEANPQTLEEITPIATFFGSLVFWACQY